MGRWRRWHSVGTGEGGGATVVLRLKRMAHEHQWVMGILGKVAVELGVHRGALVTWAVDGAVEEFGAGELRRDWGVGKVGKEARW